MTAIILVGAPGTGKTTVVGELARLGWTAADVGTAVAAMNGYSLEDFYLLLDPSERKRLLAEGIGAFLDDIESEPQTQWALAIPSEGLGEEIDDDGPFATVRERLSRGTLSVVHLTADLTTLVTRNRLIGPRSATMVMPRKEFRGMLERRLPIYESVATLEYDTTERQPEELAKALISLI